MVSCLINSKEKQPKLAKNEDLYEKLKYRMIKWERLNFLINNCVVVMFKN